MVIPRSIRSYVRQRANFVCEYCGVSEVDTGGELTVDHFQPLSQDGTDDLENLVYSCIRCNQYKLDYWPKSAEAHILWNPRTDVFAQHFLLLSGGSIEPLTARGAFTIKLLRLNRLRLIEHRRQKQQESRRALLLSQSYKLIQSYEHLAEQQTKMIEEQQRLLAEQAELLRQLLG